MHHAKENTNMTKSPAEQASYDLAQISMKLPRVFGQGRPAKRTWRVFADRTVVGYINRKRTLEFGTGSHAERVAMAWAEGLEESAAKKFAAEYPDLNSRSKQTHLTA